MRLLLSAVLLVASIAAAHAFGLGREGKLFGRLGFVTAAKKAVVIPSCSGTGLNFSIACNSQYIGVI